jgi:signal transduction histidine kinase
VRHGIQDYLIKGQAYGPQTARAIRYAIERKQMEEALRKAQAGLERKVEERTTQLSEANRDLREEIAQRQWAEEAHRQVLRRLEGAEETERGRISRELHDRLGQDLTALKLGLQLVKKQGPFTPSVQASIGQLENLADSLMRDIHRLAWELRPAALDDFGLDMALRRYTTEWAEHNGVTADFHSQGMETHRLPTEVETTLYRITQEALTNVLRHAKAQRVGVLLERRPDHVLLIVEDDGQGFDAQAALKEPGAHGKLGLLGMQERVILANGTIEIESAPGAGTTVFVRIPLESKIPAVN